MKIEDQKEVWDEIAPKWNEFRKDPIKEIVKFLKVKPGKILDLGCGSGRHLMNIKYGKMYLVDFSQGQIHYAKEHAKKNHIEAEFDISPASKLNYEENFFDSAIYINTLHCIPKELDREKSLKELHRVMKPGAQAMISVWSRNSERVKNKPKEAFIPWTVDDNKHMRYYYIYEKDELESLLKNVGFKIIKSWEGENIFYVVEKLISS
ncbi:MAG TPA: class I SAM-dependent methyltransferase [Candidatus Nanoarchaeia archaeon]|nr:class I SAM-dependent methyltransferase [Candidatus Nanoarchaeia archaeon]